MTERDVLDTLLQKLYGIVAAPDNITGVRTERAYLSLPMPGIPLPPDALDFGFATMTDDQIQLAADFSDFADVIPVWGSTWRPSGRKVSSEYWKAIEQPILPLTELKQQEKEAYQRAYDLLWTKQKTQDLMTGAITEVDVHSLWVQRYDEYRKAWEAARNAYDLEYITYLNRRQEPGMADYWSHRKPFLEAQVKNAFAAWEGAGKRRVEEARALIGNLDGRGLTKSWQDRRQRFDQYKKGAATGDFLLTKYFPQKFWSNAAGWLTFTLSHKEVHTVADEEQKNWGANSGFSFGLWSFGGDTAYDSTKSYAKSDTTSFELSFELALIPLLRGWFDAGVLGSRNWKFDRNLVPESEDLASGAIPPKGTMPNFTSALVFARNVRIAMAMTSDMTRHSMEQVRTSAKAGWGPFTVRGNYYRKTTNSTHDFVEDSAGITVPGMQVIGCVCTLLDKCPNPDDSLNWPDKQQSHN